MFKHPISLKIKDSQYVKNGIKLSDLNFDIISTNSPNLYELDLHQKSYRLWKSVWNSTYKNELNIKEDLFSDSFLFNKEIGVLSHKGEPISLILYNYLNMNLEPQTHHSYFKNYPKEVIGILQNNMNKSIMTIAGLAVLPDWRKKHTFLSVSELSIGLALATFQKSSTYKLISFTRNSRKINDTLYMYGGLPIKKNHSIEFDDNVDIVSFSPQSIKNHANPHVQNYLNQNQTIAPLKQVA